MAGKLRGNQARIIDSGLEEFREMLLNIAKSRGNGTLIVEVPLTDGVIREFVFQMKMNLYPWKKPEGEGEEI